MVTGWIADTPSSVALLTTKSVAVFFSGAKHSQRSEPESCSRRRVSSVTVAARRDSDVIRPSHSPSSPLNSASASPTAAAQHVLQVVRLARLQLKAGALAQFAIDVEPRAGFLIGHGGTE